MKTRSPGLRVLMWHDMIEGIQVDRLPEELRLAEPVVWRYSWHHFNFCLLDRVTRFPYLFFEVHARAVITAGAAAEAVVVFPLWGVGSDGLQGRHLQLRLGPARAVPRGQPPLVAEPHRTVRGRHERSGAYWMAEVRYPLEMSAEQTAQISLFLVGLLSFELICIKEQ